MRLCLGIPLCKDCSTVEDYLNRRAIQPQLLPAPFSQCKPLFWLGGKRVGANGVGGGCSDGQGGLERGVEPGYGYLVTSKLPSPDHTAPIRTTWRAWTCAC